MGEMIIRFVLQNWLLVFIIVSTLIVYLFFLLKRKNGRIKDLLAKIIAGDNQTLYSKIGIMILILIMVMIVLVSFFNGDPEYEISDGLVYVLGLIILIIFSGSIKNLKVGELISLEREIKGKLEKDVANKAEQVKNLTSENNSLRLQLTSVVNSFNYSKQQTNININNPSGTEVEKVPDNEQDNDVLDLISESKNTSDSAHKTVKNRFIHLDFENRLLEKYIAQKGIDAKHLQHAVRFKNYFDEKDPIMEYRPIFDGYIKLPLEELFIECKSSPVSIPDYYKFYCSVSLILQYAQTKKKAAKLIVLVPICPLEFIVSARGALPRIFSEKDIEKLRENFYAAIQNGFMEIVPINFDMKECEEIISTNDRK